MNRIFGLILIFTSFSTFSSVTPCGQHPLELKFKDLNWEKIYSVNMTSNFGDMETIICAGFDTRGVKELVYREKENSAIVDKIENFLSPRVIFSSDMLPSATRFLVRSGSIVVFKVVKFSMLNANTQRIELSTRFLRNISRSLAASDFREIIVQADFSLNDKRFTNRLKGSQTSFTFDHADLKLKIVPIKISEILFKNQGREVEKFKTITLPIFEKIL